MNRHLGHTVLMPFLLICLVSCSGAGSIPRKAVLSNDALMDKIKGGWAGKTIGCTYGGPTEFKYYKAIPDSVEITWQDHQIKQWFVNSPGLFDDVYMDLTFVDVFDRLGLQAPLDSFAMAFASKDYGLCHANQNARYNIRQGLMPPESGFYKNNPHADCIDFQIEADYAGLMSPGLPGAAAYYADSIGHMISYGDGWYGGVYVATMYSLAFVLDDVNAIVEKSLAAIPRNSRYYKAVSDVISWHKEYPDDWRKTWQLLWDRHSSEDIGCPDGIFSDFNIDAVLNSCYVVIGLLYGGGDFHRTMEIATRCGEDSDCNPSTAAGILGTMLGYSNIPQEWKSQCEEVETMDFAYTDISLNRAYGMTYRLAKEVIARNGGTIGSDSVTIRTQKPRPVRFEQSFNGLVPQNRVDAVSPIDTTLTFTGRGIIVNWSYFDWTLYYFNYETAQDYEGMVEITLDGKVVEIAKCPENQPGRRQELFYCYDLPQGEHSVSFRWLNPQKDKQMYIMGYITFE